MLDLKKVKLIVKTNYAGRRSETPLLSVSSAGTTSLNTAFKNLYTKNFKGKSIFLQLTFVKNEYYLLFSKKKLENFYSFCRTGPNGFNSNIKGMYAALGKKGVTVRYSLTKEETNNPNILAFKLKNVIEDLIISKEK